MCAESLRDPERENERAAIRPRTPEWSSSQQIFWQTFSKLKCRMPRTDAEPSPTCPPLTQGEQEELLTSSIIWLKLPRQQLQQRVSGNMASGWVRLGLPCSWLHGACSSAATSPDSWPPSSMLHVLTPDVDVDQDVDVDVDSQANSSQAAFGLVSVDFAANIKLAVTLCVYIMQAKEDLDVPLEISTMWGKFLMPKLKAKATLHSCGNWRTERYELFIYLFKCWKIYKIILQVYHPSIAIILILF